MMESVLEYEQRLARDCPEMPDDFWPDLTIRGKYENFELEVAFTRDEMRERGIDYLVNVIEPLRFAFWQSAKWKT